MATRPKPAREEQTTGDDDWRAPVASAGAVIVPTDDEPESATAARLQTLIDSMGQTERAKLVLYRVNPVTKRIGWCDDIVPEEFESGGVSLIRDKWGPGEYRLQLMGVNGHGRGGFGVIRSTPIVIEAAPQVAAPPVSNGNADMARVLEAMAAAQQAFQSQVVELLRRPDAAPVDPMASMMNNLVLMAKMREVFAPPPAVPAQAPLAGLAESVAALRMLREVGDEFGAQGKREPSDLESIMSLAMPALQMLASRGGTPAGLPHPGRPVAPVAMLPDAAPGASSVVPFGAVAPAQPNPDPEPLTTEQIQTMNAVRVIVDQFEGLRVAGNAPDSEPVIDALLNLSETSDMLTQLLDDPTAIEALAQADERVRASLDWYAAAHAAYLALPVDDDPAPGESAPQTAQTGAGAPNVVQG